MKLLTSFFLVILCAASFASAQSSGAGSPPVQPAAPSAAGTATGPMGAGATPGPSGAAAAQTAGSVTYTLQQVLAQGMKNGPAVQTARLTLQSAGD
ncbi:MAG TPA: hypothetical protein VMV68_04120, partial [Spirochaetia bacterium]|nr:hypothetical protein [Spirochaetia bacterium]